MARSRPLTFLASAAALPLIALSVAACGGGGGATAATPPATSAAPAAKTPVPTVTVAHNSKLGQILVDSQGRTVYLFKGDSGTTSKCTGACATAWPPLRSSGAPKVGSGLNASLLGTTRSGGATQVTYNGHPLYLFIKDQKPGEANGQGVTAFGAAWFALSPAGKQVSAKTPGTSSSSSSASHPPAAQPKPPAAKPATQPPAAKPTTQPPAAKPPAPKPASNGIPQNNGGDGDSDNNGGPSDGDGNL
jgi:predicted lipoprotein with Yx(FWY)xxD motif